MRAHTILLKHMRDIWEICGVWYYEYCVHRVYARIWGWGVCVWHLHMCVCVWIEFFLSRVYWMSHSLHWRWEKFAFEPTIDGCWAQHCVSSCEKTFFPSTGNLTVSNCLIQPTRGKSFWLHRSIIIHTTGQPKWYGQTFRENNLLHRFDGLKNFVNSACSWFDSFSFDQHFQIWNSISLNRTHKHKHTHTAGASNWKEAKSFDIIYGNELDFHAHTFQSVGQIKQHIMYVWNFIIVISRSVRARARVCSHIANQSNAYLISSTMQLILQ